MFAGTAMGSFRTNLPRPGPIDAVALPKVDVTVGFGAKGEIQATKLK